MDQDDDDGSLRVLARHHNIHARAEWKVDQCRHEAGDVDRIIIGKSWPTCQFRGDQVRAHNQSQDRQRARPRRSRDAVRPRRRGDRMKMLIAAVHEPVAGPTLPTWALQQVGSYLGYSGRVPSGQCGHRSPEERHRAPMMTDDGLSRSGGVNTAREFGLPARSGHGFAPLYLRFGASFRGVRQEGRLAGQFR